MRGVRAADAVDVLIVSLGSTEGLRVADDELQASLQRAGARVAVARPHPPGQVRTLMLTDLGWSRAARAAALRALRPADARPPRAVIYSTTTAALLWPRPGAIRFDAPSIANRPGRHGLWQRPLERRRLRQAPLLLPSSAGGLEEAAPALRPEARALVVHVPVEPSGPPPQVRDIAALTYAANPSKKGLDRVLSAWRSVRRERQAGAGEELLVAGVSAQELECAGFALGEHDGVRATGALSPQEYRALVRRARVFVCAPRREDYGIAQLEALADGCQLVSTPAPGPYAALAIARALDARLVSDDLAGALHTALDAPDGDYLARARRALAPFSREAVDRVVAEQLLPRLLG